MKKLFILFTLFLTTNIFAFAAVPAIVCPSVLKIQSVGLSNNLVKDNIGHWWAGRAKNKYNTPQFWTFVIGDIYAPSKQKALLEANEALATLKYKSGPLPSSAGKLLCLYSNDEGFPSGAVTPSIVPFRPMNLK